MELKQHQLEGLVWARSTLERRLREASAVLSRRPAADAPRYAQQDWHDEWRETAGNLGILLAWDMGLGKTAEAYEVVRRLREDWVPQWRRDGWLHEELADAIENRPVLIVCRNTEKTAVWPSEYNKLYGDDAASFDISVIDTKEADARIALKFIEKGICRIGVCSYHTLRDRLELLQTIKWGVVVYDEVHTLANPQAAWTQAAYKLPSLIRIGLSGTPFTNRIVDFHAVATALQGYTTLTKSNYALRRSAVWGSRESFERTYAIMSYGRYGAQCVGARNLTHETSTICWGHAKGDPSCQALHDKATRELMHRLRFADVIDLPEPIFQHVAVPMTEAQSAMYERIVQGMVDWLAAGGGGNGYTDRININSVLSQMTHGFTCLTDLRQLAQGVVNRFTSQYANTTVLDLAGIESWRDVVGNLDQDQYSGKLNWLYENLDELLGDDNKALVFTEFAHTARNLYEDKRLAQYNPVIIDGEASPKQRMEAVQRFQNDPSCRLLIGTEAAYTGITLTAACYVILFGKVSWVPGKVMQAIRRAHRLGQTKQVSVINLYHKDTLEQWLMAVLGDKQHDHDLAIDGGNVDAAETFRKAIGRMTKMQIMNAFRGK